MTGRILAGAGLAVLSLSVWAAEPSLSLRLQTTEGRLADAEARAAFAEKEKERLSGEKTEWERRAAAAQAAGEALQRRVDGLEARTAALLEREERCRADLDLCARSRASAEEQYVRCVSQLEEASGGSRAELEEKDRLLEECRGRGADLEAHNNLLAAEKRGLERERDERVEEVAHDYDALLVSVRRERAACQGRADELGQKLAACESAPKAGTVVEREEEKTASGTAALDALRAALKDDLDGGVFSLSAGKDTLWIEVHTAPWRGAKGREFNAAGKAALKRLALALRALEGRAAVVRDGVFPAGGDGGKRVSGARDVPVTAAGAVAEALLQDGGFEPGRLVVLASPGAPSPGRAPGAVFVGSVPAALVEALLPAP